MCWSDVINKSSCFWAILMNVLQLEHCTNNTDHSTVQYSTVWSLEVSVQRPGGGGVSNMAPLATGADIEVIEVQEHFMNNNKVEGL